MRSTVRVNDGQLVSYVDHGGPGPAVLLLHSYLMDADMFAPQVASLGETFRLIAMDERGHGDTPADAPFTYWEVARDALGLLDALGVARCAVVGTSQGGFIALRMALLAPDRVAALALLGTSGAAEDPAVAAGYRQAAAAWREHGPTRELLDLTAAICLGQHDATEWQTKWRRLSGDHIDRVLTPLVERDGVLDRAGEIDCPALVLHGTADAAYPVARAHELAEALPNAEALVMVEGGAHFLSLTDADAVNPHLRTFLGTAMPQYDQIGARYAEAKSSAAFAAVDAYTLFSELGDLTGRSALDLACGLGYNTRLLRAAGAAPVVGVDISTEMIRLAQATEDEHPLDITYRVADVADLPALGTFDLATAVYLFNYAPSRDTLRAMFHSALTSLRDGGKLYAIVPNPAPFPAGNWDAFGIRVRERIPGPEAPTMRADFLTDPPTPFEYFEWSNEDLDIAAREAGFAAVHWQPNRTPPPDEHRDEDFWQAYQDTPMSSLMTCLKA